MNEQYEFLNLTIKPAIGGFLEASFITNIHVDGLVYLEKIGELKALANPPPGAQRYFSIRYLFSLAQDDKWLARAIRLIREHSRDLNSAKRAKRTAIPLNSNGLAHPDSKRAYRQVQRAGLGNRHFIPHFRFSQTKPNTSHMNTTSSSCSVAEIAIVGHQFSSYVPASMAEGWDLTKCRVSDRSIAGASTLRKVTAFEAILKQLSRDRFAQRQKAFTDLEISSQLLRALR